MPPTAVAESSPRTSARERVRRLTEAYRSILAGYTELEELSRRELELLREGRPVREVNDLLHEKRDRLREIRIEEERVTGEREWWKKARRSLPPADCRELLSLLDSISGTIERTVAGEAECRARLQQSIAWGAGAALRPAADARVATNAYTAGRVVAGERA